MNSKERVLKVLRNEEPDRVPLMYRDVPEVRSRLKNDLNLSTDEELFQYLDVDFRWVGPDYVGPKMELENGNRRDFWGVEWKYTKFSDGAGYWNEVDHPLKDVTDPKVLDEIQWPQLEWWDFSKIEEQCDRYADYAIMTNPGIPSPAIFQNPIQPLIGVERSLMEAYLNPEFFMALTEKILEFQVPFIEKMMQAANGKIDFFRIGDDFGTQQGLLMDVDTWKGFIQPGFKAMADTAKKYGAHYYQHSCGAIRDLIPAFIETGVEVLDPVQVKANGMIPAELKAEFGNQVCFSGGVDEQELLPHGTPDEVRTGVHQLLDDMARGGGFIIGPSHNFQDDIPTENILAMYEAAKTWKY
ncbi:uroporphyrinogen-III decarboxylase [Puteibacter caeruleilacunae]|nr:uroporphyrinogen-III decarboxylase [Puteibacter caeruleilacunae]